MGKIERARRARFLAAHPYCCFCGGVVATETEDHIPARSLFIKRQWPEGYVFPACLTCNGASRADELLMAWLVRIHISDEWTLREEHEFERLTEEVAKRWPEVLNGLREYSRVETRRHMREHGFRPPNPNHRGELYVVEMPDAAMDALNRYGDKLARALHYKETGRIVPADACVFATALTNTHLFSDHFPHEVLALLNTPVEVKRCRTSLNDQFDYKFAVIEGGEVSSFLVTFRESCGYHLTVFCDRERYEQRKALRTSGAIAEAAHAHQSLT